MYWTRVPLAYRFSKVLVVSAGVLVFGGLAVYVGWRRYQKRSYSVAAFLLCLPISPVLFTLAVLGATYL